MSEFMSNYGWLVSIVSWLVITWLINELTNFKSEEEWQAYVKKHPKIAFLMKVLRAIGFDRAKLVRALGILKSSNPIQNKIDSVTIDKEEPQIKPEDKKPDQ